MKSSPTFTPRSPGTQAGQGVLVGGVVSGEGHSRGSGGLPQEGNALALGGVDHGGLQDAVAGLQEHAAAVLQDRPRRGDGVLGDVVGREPGVQDDAGRLVFQKGPGGLFHDSLKLPADLGQEFAAGRRRA